jgi:Coenzyme PQQ synthesis protein D (PqqD)
VKGARPKARREGLLVRDLGDEVVVYEIESHRGHALNRTATLVWRACDGRRTVAAITAQLGHELGVPADADLVRYTLRRLGHARLLDSSVEERTLTRREIVRRIGQAAILPAVVSLLAPRPSEAATCPCTSPAVCDCAGQGNFTSCWNGIDCSSYICCNGICKSGGCP